MYMLLIYICNILSFVEIDQIIKIILNNKFLLWQTDLLVVKCHNIFWSDFIEKQDNINKQFNQSLRCIKHGKHLLIMSAHKIKHTYTLQSSIPKVKLYSLWIYAKCSLTKCIMREKHTCDHIRETHKT